jgi:hypothetical protein
MGHIRIFIRRCQAEKSETGERNEFAIHLHPWNFGRRKKKKAKSRDVMGWYFVKALVSRQVEDQIRGMQTYDEQVWLIRARNEKESIVRFYKKFNAWNSPSLNRKLKFVRWHVDEILMSGFSFFHLISPSYNRKFHGGERPENATRTCMASAS